VSTKTNEKALENLEGLVVATIRKGKFAAAATLLHGAHRIGLGTDTEDDWLAMQTAMAMMGNER